MFFSFIDNQIPELHQYELTTGLEVILKNSTLILQDRPSSKEYLKIGLDSLTLTNCLQ